jgi:hypothetical protein
MSKITTTIPSFNTNQIIDTVQNAKREWINTVVSDESFAKPAIAVLEAETSFAKSLNDSVQSYSDALTSAFQK